MSDAAQGTVFIGGFHAVIAALEDGARRPTEVLLAQHRHDERSRRVSELARAAGIPLRLCPKSELDLAAPELRHQGVLAAMPAQAFGGEDALDIPATPDKLVLVLDGVQDPHNLGACLRTAEAAGVHAVIIPKDRAAGLTAVARELDLPRWTLHLWMRTPPVSRVRAVTIVPDVAPTAAAPMFHACSTCAK